MIDIKHLSKSFGELKVLQNVSFRLEEGKVLVLIGPSGTGKSTLLRCINYLEKPDDGMITIGDITVDAKNHKKNDIYKLRRKTAMVFQNYSLFRHKTALQNITDSIGRCSGSIEIRSRRESERNLKIHWSYGESR